MNSRKCYLFFAGYYQVAAASDLLMNHQIQNRIVKAPVSIRNSCNFAVLIDAADAEMSCCLLEQRRLPIEQKEYIG